MFPLMGVSNILHAVDDVNLRINAAHPTLIKTRTSHFPVIHERRLLQEQRRRVRRAATDLLPVRSAASTCT